MRVAGNKLRHLREFFYSELQSIYEESEIEALFQRAVEHYLGWSAAQTINRLEENLNQSDLLKLYDCAKSLKEQIPLQYVLGSTWFYGLKFLVRKGVLIPRPETEELVDIIIQENKTAASFLDIGCGSGIIPVTIKKNIPKAQVYACDISLEALAISLQNARLNDSEIQLLEADVLNGSDFRKKLNRVYEVIISNPPYIKLSEAEEMSSNVKDHEPHLALFVNDEDAILFYKKIIDFCKQALSPAGKLYFELNPLTSDEVLSYARQSGIFSECKLIMDISGSLRFFSGHRSIS